MRMVIADYDGGNETCNKRKMVTPMVKIRGCERTPTLGELDFFFFACTQLERVVGGNEGKRGEGARGRGIVGSPAKLGYGG